MPRVIRFERRRASGWPLAMHAVTFDDGGLLLHSPTWLGDATVADVEAHGRPTLLFAPNHFHHLGLPRFRERWPEARAAAGRLALRRLGARGHATLAATDDVELGAGVRWLTPEGTKSGETWLSVDDDPSAGPTWIVCDAFFHEPEPVRGVEGVLLRLTSASPGLCIGKTFTGLCLADKRRYRAWVLDAIAREQPRRVLFSHGQPLEGVGAEVPGLLEAVVRRRLGNG